MSLADIQSMKALKTAKEATNQINKNPITTGTDLIAMSFAKKYGQRKFDLIDSNFTIFDDRFIDNLGQYDLSDSGSSGVATYNGGLAVTNATGGFGYFATANTRLKAPYFSCIVEVESFVNGTDPSTTDDTICVGIKIDTSHYIEAWYNNWNKHIGLDVNTGGGPVAKQNASYSANSLSRLAISINENHCTVWYDTGNGSWVYLNTFNLKDSFNFKDPSILSQFRPHIHIKGRSGTFKVKHFTVGYWGGVGSRDEALITYADGTPYRHADGRYYITYTCAGMGDNNYVYTSPDSQGAGQFRAAHMAIGLFEPTTRKIECVGKVFTNRNSMVLGDHAGHIVYDDTADQWYVMLTSWGDFANGTLTTYIATLKSSPINKITIIDSALLSPFNVTRSGGGTINGFIDPFLVKISGYWYLAYSAGGIHLAKGQTLDSLTTIGDYPSPGTEVWEGSRLVRVNNKWYISGSNINGFKIWDLNFNYIGTITVDDMSGYAQAPHFMLIPLQENNTTRYIVLCNDSTNYKTGNSRGGIVIYESTTVNNGHEFQHRLPSR